MILQSLCSYYERIAESSDGSVPVVGFSSEKMHFALVIGRSGEVVQVLDLREVKGKKKVPRSVIVPQGPKKSINIAASFLWGSTSYVLGADDKDKPERTAKCREAFKHLHRKLLAAVPDEGAKAVLAFLSSWKPEDATKLADWPEMLKGNLVFQLDGDYQYVHEHSAVRQAWQAYSMDDSAKQRAMCLVSGKTGAISPTHAAIKGIPGAQPSGASLVSFNLKASESFGKEQNYNAPIGDSAAFAYTTALNRLLALPTNRIQIGDASTVFWTERASPVEGFFGMVLDPRDRAGDDKELEIFLEAVRDGKLPSGIDPDVRFFVLGLSPNAARLSVRFWYASTVEDISAKLGQHFLDLSMIRSFESDPEYPGMWRLLRETSNQKSKDGPSPLLAGAVMQAILRGTPYPQELLSAVIGRIRAEQNINYLRAAILKAVLIRKKRLLNQGVEVSMALDRENKNVAYLLGRLFAVLEKAQQEAIPGANTTIKDRFYGSASATPRIVFPQLLRLAQHHMAKAEHGKFRDKQIEEILCDVHEFPAHLGLDQQGLFAIGYYHQRQDFFTKKDSQ